MNHLQSIEYRLKSIKYLTQLKNKYTYNKLSEIFNLPMTVLNRYIKGHVLPSYERAQEIFNIFTKHFDIKSEIKNNINFDENGYFDNSDLIGNNFLLKIIVSEIYNKYHSIGITKVLTAAVDGVPLAVLTSNELEIDTVIAKKTREAGVSNLLVETYSPGRTGMILSLYLPGKLISNQDRILIVEDIIRSGETQQALCRLVTKSKALIAGIFTLVGIGEEKWINQLKSTILLNYFNHINLKSDIQKELISAFKKEDIKKFFQLLGQKNINKDIKTLIENLIKNELIDVFINIDEPV
ncbi:MAG: phosphoribosyltransferase family protein [Candidatus Helarchaeota archaeon]